MNRLAHIGELEYGAILLEKTSTVANSVGEVLCQSTFMGQHDSPLIMRVCRIDIGVKFSTRLVGPFFTSRILWNDREEKLKVWNLP